MKMFSRAIATLIGLSLLLCFSPLAWSGKVIGLDEIVVTGTRSSQSLRNVTATLQIFNREQMDSTPAESITDFLAEKGAAFFNKWAPGQPSITLRGFRSDGQGRDFKSGVLVLISGRRAGTANLSKLSLAQLDRIEIIRGPASVSYGSQAMGGVINLITRSGLNTGGGRLKAEAGSYDKFKGEARYGGRISDNLAGYVQYTSCFSIFSIYRGLRRPKVTQPLPSWWKGEG